MKVDSQLTDIISQDTERKPIIKKQRRSIQIAFYILQDLPFTCSIQLVCMLGKVMVIIKNFKRIKMLGAQSEKLRRTLSTPQALSLQGNAAD